MIEAQAGASVNNIIGKSAGKEVDRYAKVTSGPHGWTET